MAKIKMFNDKLRRVTTAQVIALFKTADALKTEVMSDAVTPKQSGALENSAFIDESNGHKGIARLIYDTPYARRLYYHPEYNFRTDKNANARGRWLYDYINGKKKDFCRKTYARLYKKQSGV